MNTIITIGRQFGSCGREIGELVAKHFGIPCYDKELLAKVAKDSGFAEEMIERHDERPPGHGYLFLRIQFIPLCGHAHQPEGVPRAV